MKQSTTFAQVATNLLNVLQGYTKTIRLLLVMFLTLTVSAEVWGETLTLNNLGSSLTSTSNTTISTTTITATGNNKSSYVINYLQCKKQTYSSSYAMLLAKSTGAFISNKTAMPGNIKSVTVYVLTNAASKTTYHCAFSTTECTSAYTTGSTAVNITGGSSNKYICTVSNAKYFCISLGNANNGQVYKLDVEYEVDTPPSCTTNPIVSAGSNSNVTTTTATVSCLGGITSLGSAGCSIESYGFVYGTSSNPTISNTTVQVGTTYTTTGTAFSKGLTGLTANTTYYVRPYATNGNGTAYGTQTSFKTLELPKYTVILKAGPGTCAESVTESSAGAGVTLPTPTLDCGNWDFAGWAEESVNAETTTKPTLIPAGAYNPASNITLYAVYQRTETTNGGGNSVSESITIEPNTFPDKGTSSYASGAERTGAVNKISLGGHFITGNQNNTPTGSTAGTYLQCQAKNATIYNKTKLPGNITKVVINQYDAKAFSLYCGSEQLMASNNTLQEQTPSGTKINDVTAATKMTWDVSGDYTYFALKKGSNTGYVTSIVVTYTTSGSGSTIYYHSTPECAAPCTDPGLAYAIASVTKTVGDAAFTNPLTNNKNVSVTYTSTNNDVATVDNNGQVKIKAVGETTIKATWAGNADYCADEASYTLTVLPKTYTITVANNISNGSVSADKSSAVEGATIKLTATPNTGYKLGTWNIKDASNNPVSVNENGEFTMPASNVTVSATFVSLPKLATPSELSATEINPTSATLNWKWLENTYAAQLDYYYLYIKKEGDPNFTGPITYTNTSCSRTNLEPNTNYIWKVQAISKDKTIVLTSEESAESSFTTAALPTYTVSFSTGTGNPTQADIKETEGGAGIKLPVGPDPLCPDWTFAGWAEAIVTETTTEPTLFAEGTNYKPAGNCTLYAVYSTTAETTGFTGYEKVTEEPEDWSGKYLLSTGTYTAIGTFDSNRTSGHLVREAYTPGIDEKTEWEFTLAKVDNTGYSILFPDGTWYLGYASSTNFERSATINPSENVAYVWTLSVDGITNVFDNKRKIQDGGSDFRPYAQKETIVYLYKRIEGVLSTSTYNSNPDCTPPSEYTITWWANGEEFYTQTDVEGTTIEVPTTSPEAATYACDDKVFVGWVDAEISGGTNIEPTFITDFDKITENKDYFAVFATETSVGIESTIHTLTPSNSWSGYEEGTIKDDKDLTWSYCAGGQQTSGVYSLNLRNKNTEISYIASPVFAANVKNIKATIVNGSASNTRKVYICSKPTSLPTTGDLGTTEVQGGHNGELSLSFEGTMTQFYIQVSDALQFQSIVVEVGATTTYSGYVTTCEATTEALSGKFSTGKYEYAEFATGNLQYKPSTDTWRFAKQQYQYVGKDNIYVGKEDYKGWIDLFGWSADDKFGVNPSNDNTNYQGEFVDWGKLFPEEGWSTLSKNQWHYLLNQRTNAASLKQIAMVGETLGIMLFPDEWTLPAGCAPTQQTHHDEEDGEDHSCDFVSYNYTLAHWTELEKAGAIFLPAAGRRTGGWGNETISPHMIGKAELDADRHYKHYADYYAYYWTSTKTDGKVNYLINCTLVDKVKDTYTVHAGHVNWAEEARYGQSVRLAKVTSTHIEIGGGNNSTVIAANVGEKVNVKVNRTFKANDGYYTICLPFNIDADEIGKAYQIKAITEHVAGEGINVEFNEVNTLTAGQPYLLLPSKDLENPIFEGVTIVNTTGDAAPTVSGEGINIAFTGIINGGGETNGTSEYYVGNGGDLYNGKTSKLGLRAFFTITDNNGNPAKVRARVVVGENTATDLDNILNGENTTIKVIENGQLIIIRNGEKFNAQGQKL